MTVSKRKKRLLKAAKRPDLACPHPEKVPYLTALEAIHHALKRSRLAGHPLRYYPCTTPHGKTHWHLTKRVDSHYSRVA